MVLLFFGHLADPKRCTHCVAEVFEPVGARQNLDASVLDIGALYHVPIRTELGEQWSDLLFVERGHSAAARNACALRKLVHGSTLRG